MRRVLGRVGIAAAVAFSLLCSTLYSTAPARGSATTPIAVIGDSYTDGSAEGGNGPRSWPQLAWQLLADQGVAVAADVAAEGGAGYGQRGNAGSTFGDLTARAVRPDDALVVFFGSRNDQPVDPMAFPVLAASTLLQARFIAPMAKILVIGPPWPTADPPPAVLRIRDALRDQAGLVGAVFVDPIAEGWFVGRPDLIGLDGVHPTDAGHVYMAEKIAPLILREVAVQV